MRRETGLLHPEISRGTFSPPEAFTRERGSEARRAHCRSTSARTIAPPASRNPATPAPPPPIRGRRGVLHRRAAHTRHQILLAAARQFRERGYRGARIAAVLDTGGVTAGALAFHFPDKDTLARAVIVEQPTSASPPWSPPSWGPTAAASSG